jgi:iron(III) transport system substrate-binding protein
MKTKWYKPVVLFLTVFYCLLCSDALAASKGPAEKQGQQAAAARGFISAASHDEIVAMAKKEGKLAGGAALETKVIDAYRDAFKKEYPFIDVTMEEITGPEAYKRILMELKAGRDTGWDFTHLPTDDYESYVPFLKKFDILGMAEKGVLHIPVKMIEPRSRNIIAVNTNVQVVAYNPKVISSDKVPNTWEGFLRPEFKGRKFVADIRPTEIAALVPAWGLEKTLDFSRKVAAQQPVWVRGGSRTLTSMIAGEYAMFLGSALHSIKRLQAKDPTGSLQYKLVEPIPVRLAEATAIFGATKHPYASLLWLEFITSPKGQKLAEPFTDSMYSPGSSLAEVTHGKKLSIVDWDHFAKISGYQDKILEAYGFPKAEVSK